VPEIIVVEDLPSTPPPPPPVSSHDIALAKWHSAGYSWVEPETPMRNDNVAPADSSPLGSGGITLAWRGLRHDRRESDMSALSADLGLCHTYVQCTATWIGTDADGAVSVCLFVDTICLHSVIPRCSWSRTIMTYSRQYRIRHEAVSFSSQEHTCRLADRFSTMMLEEGEEHKERH
jgi:hypothetical protein